MTGPPVTIKIENGTMLPPRSVQTGTETLGTFLFDVWRNALYKMVEKSQITDSIMARVYDTVQAHDMLLPGDAVLAGVSGGPDSVALLGILKDLSHPLLLKIGVAHLNHSLRGEESDRDATFVRELVALHGFPLHIHQTDVATYARENRKSIEEAAREARYAFYRKIASLHGYNRLALGHNSDDNAEQVLMNLLRGSGPRGLMGIPPIRENWVIRPLIQVSRQEILAYLDHHHQPFVLDSSNADTRFLRNRVRHDLLPCLAKDYNPEIKSAINRLSRLLRAEDVWMEGETRERLSHHLERRDSREVRLPRDFFVALPEALARRAIRAAIKEVKEDLKRITLDHVDKIMAMVAGNNGHKNLDLPQGIRMTLTKKWLYFNRCAKPLRQLGPLHQFDE